MSDDMVEGFAAFEQNIQQCIQESITILQTAFSTTFKDTMTKVRVYVKEQKRLADSRASELKSLSAENKAMRDELKGLREQVNIEKQYYKPQSLNSQLHDDQSCLDDHVNCLKHDNHALTQALVLAQQQLEDAKNRLHLWEGYAKTLRDCSKGNPSSITSSNDVSGNPHLDVLQDSATFEAAIHPSLTTPKFDTSNEMLLINSKNAICSGFPLLSSQATEGEPFIPDSSPDIDSVCDDTALYNNKENLENTSKLFIQNTREQASSPLIHSVDQKDPGTQCTSVKNIKLEPSTIDEQTGTCAAQSDVDSSGKLWKIHRRTVKRKRDRKGEPGSSHDAIGNYTGTSPGHTDSSMADELRLSDFCVNPHFNGGTSHIHHESLRKKDDRNCLPGCTDMRCCGKQFRALAQVSGDEVFLDILSNERNNEYHDKDNSAIHTEIVTMDASVTKLSLLDMRILENHLALPFKMLRGSKPSALHTHLAKLPNKSAVQEALIAAKTSLLASTYGKLHRSSWPRRRATPPGFWRTDMPSTQEESEIRVQQQADQEAWILREIDERSRVARSYARDKTGRTNARWKFRGEKG